MQKLYATKASIDLDKLEKFEMFEDEHKELLIGILQENIPNIEEECMDIIQCCCNIMKHYDIDIDQAIINHQVKLLERGHQFVL